MFTAKEEKCVAVHLGPMEEVGENRVGIPEMIHQVEREGQKSEPTQFSQSVMSDSLQPHGLQHARPPCLSPTPGVYSNSCPLSQ